MFLSILYQGRLLLVVLCSHTALTISDSTTPAQSLTSDDLFGDFVSVPVTGVSTGGAVPQGVESSPGSDLLVDGSGAAGGAEPQKSTKESIMALYGPSASSATQQQMFGIPGIFEMIWTSGKENQMSDRY